MLTAGRLESKCRRSGGRTRAWRKARLRRWAALRAPPAVCPGLVVVLVPRLCDSVPASSAGRHHCKWSGKQASAWEETAGF